ncbi:uncharacterized protein AMSG_08829 [Thecamonas trahens ATCC 50062]|uniref:Uncharacterized protein n=1 Tax=Thecamonas trahens ATCC 50062 TaxID=461836 RepID=A0A0L0DLZ1_THETB|nr:hypothetical protein AMSG_08829 [Thecamonas trahens ATCC 50062]KNC53332.1 hypothetical protein AMSG_08829 [Thecamonas trahens ATCC 50062]|eukprot:XP_013754588.1 hypothetical protein AMSG_08829 [Thecamonas trahens ATCC 50062]
MTTTPTGGSREGGMDGSTSRRSSVYSFPLFQCSPTVALATDGPAAAMPVLTVVARGGIDSHAFTAAATSNGFLIVQYQGLAAPAPLSRRIPWPTTPGIAALTFDPIAMWLVVAGVDGSLTLVPVMALLVPALFEQIVGAPPAAFADTPDTAGGSGATRAVRTSGPSAALLGSELEPEPVETPQIRERTASLPSLQAYADAIGTSSPAADRARAKGAGHKSARARAAARDPYGAALAALAPSDAATHMPASQLGTGAPSSTGTGLGAGSVSERPGTPSRTAPSALIWWDAWDAVVC